MAFGAIIPSALGAVTKPTALSLGTATDLTTGLASWGPCDVIPLPSLKAVMFTHGTEAMRHVMEGASLRTGLLAPPAGFTAADTAVKANSTLTLGAGAGTLPNNNDTFNLGYNFSPTFRLVYWKTTLDTASTDQQVLIGANVAACLTNLSKLIEGTGTQGSEYFDGYQANIIGTYDPDYWHTGHKVELDTLTATTIKVRATTSGTGGNALYSSEGTDSANTQVWSNTPLMTGGAVGTGTNPGDGTFSYAEAHYRSTDAALSAISTPYVTFEKDGNTSVSIAAGTTFATRDATDYRRFMRTLSGADQFYQVKDVTGTTLTDDNTDDDLAFDGAFKYDSDIYRPRVNGYPVVGKFGAVWRASLWVGGADISADYTTGTATGTVDTTTVTLSAAARPKEDMIGRYFFTGEETTKYLIVDVTPHASAPTLTLASPLRVGISGVGYTIRDDRDPFRLHKSVPTLINNFRPGDSFDGVTSPVQTGITGLVSIWDSLVIFTKTGVWRMTGGEGAYNLQPIGEGMGCHTGKAAVVVGGELYWIGPDGLWKWASDGAVPVCLSKEESPEPEGIQATIDRINVDDAEIICSNYNPSSKKIRWWVPLDGEPTNRYVIRYDLQTRGFAVQTDSDITEARTVPGPGGSYITVAGDAFGHLWHLDLGYSDGFYGYEPVSVIANYTASTRKIGLTSTPYSTTSGEYDGMPVLILPAAGPPYEYGKIASSTSVQFVLTCQPSITPAAGDYIIPGGIVLDLESSFDYEQPELLKWIEGITVAHDVETLATELWVAAGVNNGTASVFVPRSGSAADSGLMTASDGEKHYWLRTARGRTLKIRFIGIARGGAIRLHGFVISIRVPQVEEVEG